MTEATEITLDGLVEIGFSQHMTPSALFLLKGRIKIKWVAGYLQRVYYDDKPVDVKTIEDLRKLK